MKAKIGILALLCALVVFSCQKEDATPVGEGITIDQTEDIAELRQEEYAAVICVIWGRNMDDPVVGARLYDEATNRLIGETDRNGSVYITSQEPAVYRVVDPQYGRQQARLVFPDDFIFGKDGKGKRIIGWGLDGKPIYG
ncbi:MAG: hypothetical protein AAFV95_25715 [Bacteroidota bacterium]